ncbi:hypothetical protein [Oxynema aestuarii]|uniref:Uncharacterized protein n=1 Tax=Oxynema aestuarii AP17 TaxID=2064643 RepID=A0A6H1TYW9_9CYAN|nr:hypothetical protein [Oxynema aestuarii]QIZ70559.1 hypothetical protein HCG48_08185 [Oxynema aestuarii AP17]
MKNFSLSLYAFHLRQALDDPPDSVNPEADRLWESLTQLSKVLDFPELKNLKSQLICYSPDSDNRPQYHPQAENTLRYEWLSHHAGEVKFTAIPTPAGFKLGGKLQPFRLHDTYCVDLTLSPDPQDLELGVENLGCFHPKDLVSQIEANLGKFVWLTGYSTESELPKQAEAWVNAFCAKTGLIPEFIEGGKLFHADCFLYEAQNITILISIANPNNSTEVEQSANDNYDRFRNLLWSRQKILFVQEKAKQCYENTRKIYSQLENQINSFYELFESPTEARLKKLDSLLTSLPKDLLEYNCYLRDLKAHYTTLDTNAQNFKTCLDRVIQPGDNLQTWADFAEKICPRFLTQIKTYINYLEPGKELFTELVNTIRATATVEQTKANQDLQDHIQAIGVGIAAGAIVASSFGLVTQPWYFPNREKIELPFLSPHPLIMALIFSGLCSVGSWLIARKVIEQKRGK